MDDIEVLAELDEVGEVFKRAGAPAASRVHDVRWAGGGREAHVAPALLDVQVRVHRVEGEFGRAGGQRLLHQLAVELHHLGFFVHFSAASLVGGATLGGQHLVALGFQQRERGLVDGLHLVLREDLHGLERVLQMAVSQRARRRGRGSLLGASTAAGRGATARGRGGFSHVRTPGTG